MPVLDVQTFTVTGRAFNVLTVRRQFGAIVTGLLFAEDGTALGSESGDYLLF